jgi:surface antigen
MRFYRCVALFATVVAVCTFLAGLALIDGVHAADDKPAEQPDCSCPNRNDLPKRELRPKFAELQSGSLDEGDEIAVLEAIRVALTEVGDGAKFVWHRYNGRIRGVVTPTSSFKDARGRICRHLVLLLATAWRTGKVEGIACRAEDGRWEIDG